MLGHALNLRCLVKYIDTVLSVFKVRHDWASHSATFSIADDNLAATTSPWVKRTVSSVYVIVCTLLQTKGRSLMYAQNNRGPRIDPWGTPMIQVFGEDVLSLILTHWEQYARYNWSQFNMSSESLKLDKFRLWLTVSKATGLGRAPRCPLLQSFDTQFIYMWKISMGAPCDSSMGALYNWVTGRDLPSSSTELIK